VLFRFWSLDLDHIIYLFIFLFLTFHLFSLSLFFPLLLLSFASCLVVASLRYFFATSLLPPHAASLRCLLVLLCALLVASHVRCFIVWRTSLHVCRLVALCVASRIHHLATLHVALHIASSPHCLVTSFTLLHYPIALPCCLMCCLSISLPCFVAIMCCHCTLPHCLIAFEPPICCFAAPCLTTLLHCCFVALLVGTSVLPLLL